MQAAFAESGQEFSAEVTSGLNWHFQCYAENAVMVQVVTTCLKKFFSFPQEMSITENELV